MDDNERVPSEDDIEINLEEAPQTRGIGEEAWSNEAEALAIEWGDQAKEASSSHNNAGKAHKFKHVAVGLPAALIPIVMAPISATFADSDGIQYANMVGFLLSGALSTAHSFFGFDRKYQKHMDYSARYGDVYTDVRYELAKSRKFRVSSDQFLLKIQMKMDSLGQNAPDL